MQTITAQQSRDARRELGLSQANVTKALDFNRQYLSEFETGFSTRLTNSQLKKLKAFYEDKIEEANANGEEIHLTFGESSEKAELFFVETSTVKRLAFEVDHDISDATFNSTLSKIKDNDNELEALLGSMVIRNDSFLGEGELSKDSLSALRDAFSLLSANYLLIKMLTGWPQLGLSASNIDKSTDSILGLVVNEVLSSLEQSGFFDTPELETLGGE